MNKIEVVNLNKEYPAFRLKDVSFGIPKGYVTGFIGKTGMGKTTTIKSILSMLNYDGTILIDGKNTKETNFHQEVGVVMDDSFLAKDWNSKHVNSAMRVGYDNWDEARFFQYLDEFNIDQDLKVKELSRGMKIKLISYNSCFRLISSREMRASDSFPALTSSSAARSLSYTSSIISFSL